jgi:carbonic anhydrase/acetyltransferase-like protein (isoleucine patch superfamily)
VPIVPFRGHTPEVDPGAFIAPSAWVTGRVSIAEEVSILFGAALRGDLERIIIGRGSNIQDNAVLHTSNGYFDCVVGPGVTVGHGAILHGCEIRGRAIIGMGATILDGAVIGERSIIGAQSLVPLGMEIPEGSLVMGVPARIVRTVNDAEVAQIDDTARRYVEVGREYARALREAGLA